jgi:hypothetical protein
MGRAHPPPVRGAPSTGTTTPETFARAVAQLRAADPRREIELTELSAPRRLAPYAYALGATVTPRPAADEVATGRLVLLHDPAAPEPWDGDLRLVTYVSAELEPDLATDPLLADVGWSWLTDALAAHAAGYTALGGTVTQTTSTRFGDLSGSAPAADIELRASWTPTGGAAEAPADLGRHALAWFGLLAAAGGLPPPGVTALPARHPR